MNRFRFAVVLAAATAVLAMVAVEADARMRGSFGSRGARTYSAPPPTATAPTAAQPMQRSVTQPGQAAQPSAVRTAPQPAAAGSMFSRPGFLGGLAAGFLGAGLIGLLFGQGLFGNLGGLAAFLGLLLQIGLVILVARLLWNLWQRRSQPAYASAGPGGAPAAGGRGHERTALVGLGGGSMRPADDDMAVAHAELETFERMLGEIQNAYGRGDLAALRQRVTPEMLSYYSEALSADVSRGVENRIGGIKLLQGDVSEAWREGDMEYATVAMRYELVDKIVDTASGRVIEGGDEPQEATEIWTFVRARGGNWLLSAVQQTDE